MFRLINSDNMETYQHFTECYNPNENSKELLKISCVSYQTIRIGVRKYYYE